jgi:hypothetical protein
MPGEDLFAAQVVLLWVNFVMIAALGLVRLIKGLRGINISKSWSLVGWIFLVALLLRMMVSPHTLLHENAHGYEFLQTAFSLQGYPFHGAGYYAFFHPLSLVFGQEAEVVFFVNALLGALTCVLLIRLARRILPNYWAPWFAGVIYAVWPLALRVSASESMFPLAVCAGLAAWLAWLEAWETGGPVRFGLAACLTALAIQVRPEMTLWIPVMLVSLIGVPGWSRKLASPSPWAALVLWAALCSVWAWFRIQLATSQGLPGYLDLTPAGFFYGLLSSRNLFLEPNWTPLLAWPLSGLGFWVLFRFKPDCLWPLLGGFLIMAWPVLGVTTGESSWVRLQQPLQPFIVMWVALGAGWAVGRLNRGHTFAAIILGGVLVGVCLGRVPQIQKIANPQMEYAFLREQAPLIDPDCSVVIADRFMAERKISTEYPMWWSRAQVVEMTPFMESVSGRRSCAVFYLGLSCWMFGERETPGQDGMRPECKRLEQEYWLTPIAEWIQPSRPYTAFSVPSARITFGFYRLKPKGSPAEAPLRPPVEILEQLPR